MVFRSSAMMLISGSRYTHGALIKTFICGTFAYWHCGHQGQHTCTLTWYIQSYQILSFLFFIFSFIFFLTFLSLLLSLSNVFFFIQQIIGLLGSACKMTSLWMQLVFSVGRVAGFCQWREDGGGGHGEERRGGIGRRKIQVKQSRNLASSR